MNSVKECIRDTDKNLETLSRDVLENAKTPPDLYIACGYNDSLVYDNRRLSAYLSSINYTHVYEEGAGTHEWPFWSAFLRRGLGRLPLDVAPKPLSPYWVEAGEDSPNPVIP